MARKFVLGAFAVLSVATLGQGTATAVQANPSGSLSSVSGSLAKKDLDIPTNPKVRQGNIGGPFWNADLYTQLFGSGEVAPGAEVKIRLEMIGVKWETKVEELRHSMPDSFTLKKVETLETSLLGIAPKVLNQGEYTTTTKDGRTEAHVSLKEGLIFKTAVKVSSSKSLIVDFTWTAPQQEGEYKYSAGATVGSWLTSRGDYPEAGTIKVVKGAKQGGMGSLGNLGGSGALGSLSSLGIG